MHISRSTQPLRERFYEKMAMSDDESCWIWLANTTPKGYGLIRNNGAYLNAHRVSYELHVGPIPEGMYACHTCDNPGCVNPYHLFAGTARDNQRDCIDKGRNRPRRGEDNHYSKLTAEDVIVIRKMAKEGKRQQDIAQRFGIAKQTVSCIVCRRSWAHIE